MPVEREPRLPREEAHRIAAPAPEVAPDDTEATPYIPGRTVSSRRQDILEPPEVKPGKPSIWNLQDSARTQLERLEGVWSYSRFQHPSGVQAQGPLEGYAIVCDHVMMYHMALRGGRVDHLRSKYLFEAGGFTLTPLPNGTIRAVPRGGFGNMDEELKTLPSPGNPRKRKPEPYSAQSNPFTKDREQDPAVWEGATDTRGGIVDERRITELATVRDIVFVGPDTVRISQGPHHYIELRRVVTDRLRANRHGALLARAREGSQEPPGTTASSDRSTGPLDPVRKELPQVLHHREQKQKIQGVWSVETIQRLQAANRTGTRGEFCFLDGYLIYRVGFTDRTAIFKRVMTFFQIGVRKYAVTPHGEIVFEDLTGLTNVTRRMKEIRPGDRARHQLRFESDQELVLQESRSRGLSLRRVGEPGFIKQSRILEPETKGEATSRSRKP